MTKHVIRSILWVQGNIPRNYNHRLHEIKHRRPPVFRYYPASYHVTRDIAIPFEVRRPSPPKNTGALSPGEHTQKGCLPAVFLFSLLYSLGAYLRLHGFPNLLVKRGKIIAILLIALIALWAELNQFLPNFGMDSAWKYNNPLVILYAVILFGFFLRLKISSSFINSAAKIVYPLFLIHCCVIKHINISYYCQKSFYDIVFCYLVFSFSMYILSWLVYYLYKRTVGLLIYKMFSYNIDCFRMKESNVKC